MLSRCLFREWGLRDSGKDRVAEGAWSDAGKVGISTIIRMPFFKMMGHDGQTQEFRRVLNRKTKLARKMSDDDYDVALRFLRWMDYFQKTSLGLPGATGWDQAHRWVDNLERRPVDGAREYYEKNGISDEPHNPQGQTPGYAVILPRAACWYLGDRGIESGVAYRDFKYQWET